MRGNTRAVPLALAYMRTLERLGRARAERRRRVRARVEQERAGDAAADARHRHAASITFNDVARRCARYADRDPLAGAAQAGSGRQRRAHPGRRIARRRSRRSSPPIRRSWLPDNLFLLQEYLPHDPEQGIVRLEFLGGELLYAMRVKTHGRFNLCPSPVCNPDDGDGACASAGAQAAGRRRSSSSRSRCAAGGRRHRDADRPRARSSTSAASSISRRRTAGGCSTTSTRTRTCGRRSPRHSASIRSSASSRSSLVSSVIEVLGGINRVLVVD